MKAPDEVSAMLRLKALGWVPSALPRNLGARATRCAAGWPRAIGALARPYPGRRSWTDYPTGLPIGFAAMLAMPMWFARSWRLRKVSLSACGRLNVQRPLCAGSW
jgi:hypothetical protein